MESQQLSNYPNNSQKDFATRRLDILSMTNIIVVRSFTILLMERNISLHM